MNIAVKPLVNFLTSQIQTWLLTAFYLKTVFQEMAACVLISKIMCARLRDQAIVGRFVV